MIKLQLQLWITYGSTCFHAKQSSCTARNGPPTRVPSDSIHWTQPLGVGTAPRKFLHLSTRQAATSHAVAGARMLWRSFQVVMPGLMTWYLEGRLLPLFALEDTFLEVTDVRALIQGLGHRNCCSQRMMTSGDTRFTQKDWWVGYRWWMI